MTRQKIIVVSLSKERRGGVATVLQTLASAGFFSGEIVYHSSCGDGSQKDKLVSAIRQWGLFLSFLRRQTPALAHIHFSSDMSFWRKVPYILACRVFHTRLLLHVHPSHFWEYWQKQPRWIRRWMNILLSKADAIAFANPALIERFRTILPATPLLFLPNPIDLRKYPFSTQPRKQQVLFLGALLKGKGVYDIIRSVPLLRPDHPQCSFVLCGDHEVDRVRRAVEEKGLTAQGQVRTWVGYEEKLALLQQSAVLVLPSFSEGFPVVVLEAMACGLPVIATPVGGLAAVMCDGEQLLFTAPGNPAMLARQIDRLLRDEPLRQRLIRNGLSFVQLYDVQGVIERYHAAYRAVLQGEPHEKAFAIQGKNI